MSIEYVTPRLQNDAIEYITSTPRGRFWGGGAAPASTLIDAYSWNVGAWDFSQIDGSTGEVPEMGGGPSLFNLSSRTFTANQTTGGVALAAIGAGRENKMVVGDGGSGYQWQAGADASLARPAGQDVWYRLIVRDIAAGGSGNANIFERRASASTDIERFTLGNGNQFPIMTLFESGSFSSATGTTAGTDETTYLVDCFFDNGTGDCVVSRNGVHFTFSALASSPLPAIPNPFVRAMGTSAAGYSILFLGINSGVARTTAQHDTDFATM